MTNEHCEEKSCVLCNPCAYCEGAADLFNPATGFVVCIDCVKANLLDD